MMESATLCLIVMASSKEPGQVSFNSVDAWKVDRPKLHHWPEEFSSDMLST